MDWYSLGVLIFEMFTGEPPFFSDSQSKIFNNICEETLIIPHTIPPLARDLIKKLMDRDPSKRLEGMTESGVRGHPWFEEIGTIFIII